MWERMALPEVLDFREGPGILAKDFRGGGVPLIRLAGLKGHSVVDGCNFLNESDVLTRWSQFRLRLGDTLLSTSASLGEVATVDPAGVGAVPYTGIISFRPKDDRVASEFIPLMLKEKSFKDQIEAMGVGSVMKHFGPSHLRHMTVTVPPRPEQQAIAEVLGALDDKIAANRTLAASIDRYLSTEFEGRLRSEATTNASLSGVATIVLGGTPSRARPDYWADGTVPWLNSGAANATRIVAPSEYITAEALAKSAAKVMPVGTTLIAITGATLGQVARLEIEASGNQSLVGVWSTEAALNTWLHFAIRARLGDLLARATGAAQQHVSKGDVESLEVPLAERTGMQDFAGIAMPLLDAAALAEHENRTLATIREALLPQLMSGKLRVRDARRSRRRPAPDRERRQDPIHSQDCTVA